MIITAVGRCRRDWTLDKEFCTNFHTYRHRQPISLTSLEEKRTHTDKPGSGAGRRPPPQLRNRTISSQKTEETTVLPFSTKSKECHDCRTITASAEADLCCTFTHGHMGREKECHDHSVGRRFKRTEEPGRRTGAAFQKHQWYILSA